MKTTAPNQALSELHRANRRALAGAGLNEQLVLDALNRRHVGVLEQPLAAGAIMLHIGLARHGAGHPFCAPKIIARESLGAFRSPYFSPKLKESQRIWCGIVWLEQNRGCPSCIEAAYKFADEHGWKQPRRLGELLAA
jgi:hypothetical protein